MWLKINSSSCEQWNLFHVSMFENSCLGPHWTLCLQGIYGWELSVLLSSSAYVKPSPSYGTVGLCAHEVLALFCTAFSFDYVCTLRYVPEMETF